MKGNRIIVFMFICLWGGILWGKNCDSANVIYDKAVKSVVELKASDPERGDSYGTAVCIAKDGILVTNAHVVTYRKKGSLQCYDKLLIRIPVEETYHKVSLVKYSEELDIAVLKLEMCDVVLKPISIGKTGQIDYGNKVYAVGNAMNYGISITEGIISAPEIQMEYDDSLREVIQTDLNIMSGSSGGALLDEKGRLIGITSFRTKDSSGNVVYGMGFSVPVDKVMEYVPVESL